MKDNHNFLGFESLNDFTNTLFGLKYSGYNTIIAFIASLTGIITNYIYADAKAVYLMLVLLVLDFITGVIRAIKYKNFTSSKLPRLFVNAVVYTVLLSISWNMANAYSLFSFLPGLVYGGLVTTLFISLLENLNQLKLLPKGLFKKIIDKLPK